jgi:hypothetical protein
MPAVSDQLRNLARARAAAAKGRWAEAAALWERAVESNPVNGGYWDQLAGARWRLEDLLSGARDDPRLLAQIQEQASDAGSRMWLTILGRAVAGGEAAPEALHPRVAIVAVVLLRNEYVTRGVPTVPDSVIVEIVDEV